MWMHNSTQKHSIQKQSTTIKFYARIIVLIYLKYTKWCYNIWTWRVWHAYISRLKQSQWNWQHQSKTIEEPCFKLFATYLLWVCATVKPKDWCTHCVVPIFKSGDKSSVCNYRPISVLCILSKVLERIVYNSMLKHMHVEGSLTNTSLAFSLIDLPYTTTTNIH